MGGVVEHGFELRLVRDHQLHSRLQQLRINRTDGGLWRPAASRDGDHLHCCSDTGLAPGTYQVGVWARSTGSPAAYDTFFIGTYQLAAAACMSAALSASPSSPQGAGTQVTLTATSAGCVSAQYEFWGRPPGGQWILLQVLGAAATYTWNTSGSPTGNYNFAVWATATGNDYDTYATSSFSIS